MTHPEPVTVRRATPDDATALAELAALTFPLACPPGADPEAMAAHVAEHLSPSSFRGWAESDEHALLLVESAADLPDGGPRLLGYALLVRGVPADQDVVAVVGASPSVELSKIYAHPDVHGSGVASTLMAASLKVAQELGPGLRLWLGTNGENARAQAFYRKSGFTHAGERTYVVGGEEHDDVVMVHTS